MGNDDHLAVWEAEQFVPESEKLWLAWVDRVEKLLGHDTDGDQTEDGYSLDWFYDLHKAGRTPEQAVALVPTRPNIGWGARDLVPRGAKAAWGARLIVTQTGDVDIVHNRQDAQGISPSAVVALLDRLNAVPWRDALSGLLHRREVRTREEKEVTVYEDETIAVRGNSNGSAGYFYVAAWLKG